MYSALVFLGAAAVAGEGYENKTVACKETAEFVKQSGCVERCGSLSVENFLSEDEVKVLKGIAVKGLGMGIATGPASIVDLHQGVVSNKDHFISYFERAKAVQRQGSTEHLITKAEVALYRDVVRRLLELVQTEFGLKKGVLGLATPAFISRLSHGKQQNPHDEYWHEHIDTKQYGSFAFTTLTYLSEQGKDFTGGSLVINSDPINPRPGLVAAFTSGSENPHHVDRVTSGTRFAVTTAFTCNGGTPVDKAFASLPLKPDDSDSDSDSNPSPEL